MRMKQYVLLGVSTCLLLHVTASVTMAYQTGENGKLQRGSEEIVDDYVSSKLESDMTAYYENIELSSDDLTEQQNDHIFTSIENEKIKPQTGWSADAGGSDENVEAISNVEKADNNETVQEVTAEENKTAKSEKKGFFSKLAGVFKRSDNKTEIAKAEPVVVEDVDGNKGYFVPAETNMKEEAYVQVAQVSEPVEVEEEAIEALDEDVQEEAAEEQTKGSSWTKVKDKLTGSSSTPQTEEEYWDVPVKEQSLSDISANLDVDAAFKEAQLITLPEAPAVKVEAEQPQFEALLPSTEEMVRNAIPQENRDKRIDLDFDDTSLSDVLSIIADAGNMNIVLDPSLKANTLDLHLKQVRLEDALLLVFSSYNLGFKQVGGAIYVTDKEKLLEEHKVSRIVKIKNIAVQDAKDLVDSLTDKVNLSEELNSLVIMGNPDDVAKVQKLIHDIDKPQLQVLLESKIIEMNKDALKDLGVDWSDQVVMGYQESGRPVSFSDPEDSDSPLYHFSQIQRNPLQFDTTINMLETQNKAKILSAPRVTTLNGKEAEIFVGDEVPYTITNISGGVVTNDVRFVSPGIRLKITPSIIEDGFVVMKVEPEVSFIVAFRGPNSEFPQVRTREATAYVRVNDKHPFVIGGILNQEDKQVLNRVPFIGRVPLIGNLFSYSLDTAVDTDLIITVIPTIVRGQE
ncbi:MAG: hypothetical protein KBD53_02025 [Candidatus Omnitrophica bacterium]|nr:hypothetical protein [Candidatus Omnitrophota bacterium]